MSEVTKLTLAVDSTQVRRASGELDNFAKSGRRAESATATLSRAFDGVKTAAIGLTGALGLRELIAASDSYSNLNARIKLVTNSANEFAQAQQRVFEISQNTSSSFSETANLFATLARNTESLGASQSDVLDVVDAINKAIIVSGASSQSAAAALVQLGQGFASGVLRGEELNSVLEQTPRLAQAIANGLGVTVGQLRALGQEGRLTSDVVFNALRGQGAAIDAEFRQIPLTISGAFQTLNNEFIRFVGQTSEANGAGAAFAATIQLVARNLELLAAAATGFASAKIATAILAGVTATKAAIVSTVQYTASIKAQNAAAVELAKSHASSAAGRVAELNATRATIEAVRADSIAKLQQANAAITSARATAEAARSSGALSVSLALVRQSEDQVTAAQLRRVALTTELAKLGRAQAAINTQLAAATTAQAVATTGLAAATKAAGTAASVATRFLGFLGGPIGAVTTLLGFGVTAWLAWGSAGKQQTEQISANIKRSTNEIIGDLDRQIAKLRQRNNLASSPGLGSIGRQGGAEVERLADLQERIASIQRGEGAEGRLPEAARASLLQALARQYAGLLGRVQDLNSEQEKLNNQGNTLKANDWLAKYATNAERLNAELSKARKELGAAFTPEIERRIRNAFAARNAAGGGSAARNEFADSQDAGERFLGNLIDQLTATQDLSAVQLAQLELQKSEYTLLGPLVKQRIIDTAKQIDLDRELLSVSHEFNAIESARLAKQQALKDAGRAIYEETRTPLEQLNIRMEDLNELLRQGAIDWDTYSRAVFNAQDAYDAAIEGANRAGEEIDDFAKTANENIQNALGQELENILSGNFKNIGDAFSRTIQRMVVEAASADILRSLGFGEKGGGIGGIFASIFGGGRAIGGTVSAGGLYRVNERRPELLSVGGQEYLMMGNQPGKVKDDAMSAGGTNVYNVTVQMPQTGQRATAMQFGRDVARQLAMAQQRNG